MTLLLILFSTLLLLGLAISLVVSTLNYRRLEHLQKHLDTNSSLQEQRYANVLLKLNENQESMTYLSENLLRGLSEKLRNSSDKKQLKKLTRAVTRLELSMEKRFPSQTLGDRVPLGTSDDEADIRQLLEQQYIDAQTAQGMLQDLGLYPNVIAT